MKIKYGSGTTKFGPGVQIDLSGEEIATAIGAYLVAHNVYISGARTIKVNGELINDGYIYVDPSGFVIAEGEKYSGDAREKLNLLADELIENVINTSDDDILNEIKEDFGDSAIVANKVREILKNVIRKSNRVS